MKKLKLIIADNHAMFRDSMELVLNYQSDIEVIDSVPNGKLLLQSIKRNPPNVVLLDIEMPEMNGYEALKAISQNYSYIKVIVVSLHSEKSVMLDLISKGAHGFVPKHFDTEYLMTAIRTVSRNGYYISKETDQKADSSVKKESILSGRETEILNLLLDGKTLKEIGHCLCIKETTVKFHKNNIHIKTNTKGNAQLVKFAIENNLI